MREYARLYPSFWTGNTGKQIKNLGYECTIIGAYVVSSPHSNMIGLYYLPLQYIAYETGVDLRNTEPALCKLASIEFCFYDTESEFIWVPEMARYQIGIQFLPLKSNDNKVKGIENLYKSLPNNPFLPKFFDRYHDAFHLNERRAFEAPPKPLARVYEVMQCNARASNCHPEGEQNK